MSGIVSEKGDEVPDICYTFIILRLGMAACSPIVLAIRALR